MLMKGSQGGKASCRVMDGISLPWELVRGILLRLPPRYVCRATAVCKAWKQEVRSPDFVREYSAPSGGWRDAPTLALVGAWNPERLPSVAFNTELKRWVPVPTLFFHGHYTCLVAQAKGLYVHNVTSGPRRDRAPREKTQLVVSNPLTGATQWLPRMHYCVLDAWNSYVHLDVIEGGAAYRITCIEHEARCTCVEVYDSRSGSWTVFQAASVKSSLNSECLFRQGPSVMLLGSVYFVAVSATRTETIVSFNLEDRKWRLVYDFGPAATVPCSPTAQHPLHLVTCDEKLIVVQLRSKKMGGGSVFSLDVDRNLLVHETSIPNCKRLGSRMALLVVGQGHYLCVFDPKHGGMIAYNFCTKEWEEWHASPVPKVALCPQIQLVGLQFGLLPLPDTRNKARIA